MSDEMLNSVIGSIYECSSSDSWDDAIKRVTRFVGADVVHLLVGPPSAPLIDIAPNADPALGVSYRENYRQDDLRTNRLAMTKSGSLLPERMLLSRNEFRKCAIHQELFPKYKIHSLQFARLDIGGLHGWIGFSLEGRARQFSNCDLTKMQAMVPHFERALRIAKTIRDANIENAMMRWSFDRVAHAQFLLDTDTSVCVPSAMAKRLLKSGLLRMTSGRIRFNCRSANEKLDRLCRSGGLGERLDVKVQEETGREFTIRALKTQVAVSGSDAEFRTVVAVSVDVPSEEPPFKFADIAAFAKSSGLSPAEQELVYCILKLKSLRDFADERGTQIDTARKQLKSVFRKLNINIQKELLQLFARHFHG